MYDTATWIAIRKRGILLPLFISVPRKRLLCLHKLFELSYKEPSRALLPYFHTEQTNNEHHLPSPNHPVRAPTKDHSATTLYRPVFSVTRLRRFGLSFFFAMETLRHVTSPLRSTVAPCTFSNTPCLPCVLAFYCFHTFGITPVCLVEGTLRPSFPAECQHSVTYNHIFAPRPALNTGAGTLWIHGQKSSFIVSNRHISSPSHILPPALGMFLLTRRIFPTILQSSPTFLTHGIYWIICLVLMVALPSLAPI